MTHIVILGAGISGLTLGWFLKKRFKNQIKLTILEKKSNPGGWIQTIVKDGFLFELGPHSLRGGAEILSFLEELELLKNQLIFAAPEAKARYIWLNQRLVSFPYHFLPLLMKGMCKNFLSNSTVQPDESIAQYTSRRFGRQVTETLIDPLFSGIFAGNIHQLSAEACWRSRVKGAKIFSFRNGLSTLTLELSKRLHNELHMNSEVESLKNLNVGIEIGLSNGNRIHADRVFTCLPSSVLSKLIPTLEIIPTTSIVSVNLGYRYPILPHKGFGYLVPSKEKESILGVIFDSVIFPEQNRNKKEVRLSVMLGGVNHPEIMNMSDEEIKNIVLKAVERHLGISKSPMTFQIQRNFQAIPQYLIGHKGKIATIEKQCHQLFNGRLILLGNSFHGVSIADCIQMASSTSDNIFK